MWSKEKRETHLNIETAIQLCNFDMIFHDLNALKCLPFGFNRFVTIPSMTLFSASTVSSNFGQKFHGHFWTVMEGLGRNGDPKFSKIKEQL